jgi:hypothetical protein
MEIKTILSLADNEPSIDLGIGRKRKLQVQKSVLSFRPTFS